MKKFARVFNIHIDTHFSEQIVLIRILFIVLIHGLIYVFIQPPWQHYDEPGHFEYAWLIANNTDFPAVNTVDFSIRREIAASMIEHQFFSGTSSPLPNLLDLDQPAWIGIPQVGDVPVYYWIAALPLRLFRSSDVALQLYSVRLISILMLVLTVFAVNGVAREITSRGHALRWALPLSLSLHPGFVELMTAANNDVGAVLFMSLFLWIAVRLLRRGFAWLDVSLLTLFASLALFTKSTVVVIVVIYPLVLLFLLVPRRYNRWLWYAIWLCFMVSPFALLTWSFPRHWYKLTPSNISHSIESSKALLGKNVFQVDAGALLTKTSLTQPILKATFDLFSDREMILGAWVWAELPDGQDKVEMSSPSFGTRLETVAHKVWITETPQFITQIYTIPADLPYLRITLSAPTQKNVRVYYDGVVLTGLDGIDPSMTPVFIDDSGVIGIWGSQPFINLIRNPSAEQRWFTIRPFLNRLVTYYETGNLVLSSLGDMQYSMSYYYNVVKGLGQTFIAQFGWGQIKLYWRPYVLIMLIVLGALPGTGFFLFHRRKHLPYHVVLLLGLALLGVWLPTVFRGLGVLYGETWMPSARYSYPAIIPTMLILVVGWLEWGKWLRSLFARFDSGAKLSNCLAPLGIAAFVGLDILAVYSVLQYWANLQ